MSSSVGSIHYDLGLNTAEFDAKSKAMGSKLSSLGSKMQSVGRKMTLFVTTPVIAAGVAAFKAAANYEQLEVAFTTMLGSAKDAKKLLKDLDALAVKTPFSITDVQNSAKQLLAYGIAQKDIIKTTRMLGDVSAGLGVETFPNLVMAFGQIKAKGKLMGQELLQLTNAGFNLADAMGVSRGKLMEMMQTEKGVTFAQVQKAFEKTTSKGGRFNDMMKNQSKTTAGMLSNLQDNLTRLARDIGTTFLPIANDIIRKIQEWLTWFRSLDRPTQDLIVKMALLAAAIGPVTWAMGTLLRTFSLAMTIFGGAAKAVGVLRIAFMLLFNLMKANPIVALISVIATLGISIYALTQQTDRQNNSRRTEIQLANQARDAERRLSDAKLNARGASLAVERAQRTYNEAVRMYGRKSLEAREAAYQLRRAQLDLKNANEAVRKSTDNARNAQQRYVSFKNKVIAANNAVGSSAGWAAGGFSAMANAANRAAQAVKNANYQKSIQITNDSLKLPQFGKRATGGPVSAGQAYLVGENPDGSINRTTEMFVPGTSGYIMNSKNLRAALSGVQGSGDTNFYGNIIIGSQRDADYFFSILTRNQELASRGMATMPGSL